MQLLQSVPYISHLQLFRIVQHKQAPNVTVPLQHQGTCIKCHQSASNLLTATQLVQRLRRRQRLTQSVNDTTLPVIIHHMNGLKVAKTQCRHYFTSGADRNLLLLRLRPDWVRLVIQASEWLLNGWEEALRLAPGGREGNRRWGWNKRPFVVADVW